MGKHYICLTIILSTTIILSKAAGAEAKANAGALIAQLPAAPPPKAVAAGQGQPAVFAKPKPPAFAQVPKAAGKAAPLAAHGRETHDAVEELIDGTGTYLDEADPLGNDAEVRAEPAREFATGETRLRVPAGLLPHYATVQHLSIQNFVDVIDRGFVNLGAIAVATSVYRNSDLPGAVAFCAALLIATGAMSPGDFRVVPDPPNLTARGTLAQAVAYVGTGGNTQIEQIRELKTFAMYLLCSFAYGLGKPSTALENERHLAFVRRSIGSQLPPLSRQVREQLTCLAKNLNICAFVVQVSQLLDCQPPNLPNCILKTVCQQPFKQIVYVS